METSEEMKGSSAWIIEPTVAGAKREVQRLPKLGVLAKHTLNSFESAETYIVKKATRSFKFLPIASGVTPSSSAGWFWRFTQKVGYPNDLAPATSHPAKAAKRIWS